ncbi:hypothetical protein Tco_0872319 [Tanacetum coccineum]
MATMAENVIVVGAENRPPMLENDMYDSWKTRIWHYIKGKENGEMLIDSIVNGPFKLKEDITILGRTTHLLRDKQIPSVWVFDEVSFYALFRALRWLLEEIHVTWAHLEKKRTRYELYIQVDEDYCSQCMGMALELLATSSGLQGDDVKIICDGVRIVANLMKT